VPRSNRLAEFLGLLAFAGALMLLIAIATFSPTDPAPFFKAGSPGPARNFIGPFGAFIAELLVPQLFGMAALLIPLVLGILGWKLFWCRPVEAPYTKAAGLLLLLLSLTALLSLAFDSLTIDGARVRAGGAVGELLNERLTESLNRTGAFIVVTTILFVSLILSTQFSFAAVLRALLEAAAARLQSGREEWARAREEKQKERMRQEVLRKHAEKGEPEEPPREDLDFIAPDGEPSQAEAEEAAAVEPAPAASAPPARPAPATARPAVAKPATPRPRKRVNLTLPGMRLGSPLPPITILEEPKGGAALDQAELYEKGRTLQAKSGEFGVTGTVKEISPGPVVTTYEFKPDAGVKYSKVVSLADDLALALEAESIRIDRISGKGTIGIEIPNRVRETIFLREIVESEAFQQATGKLTLSLGKTVSGEPHVTDLVTMPHLLIAGATGQGKSVGLNCMIASILFKATPEEVRLILIDPKRLELGVYEDIPHLLTPVVTDPKMASNVLKWAVGEMERRIRRLASEGVRNIEQYNNVIRSERPPAAEGEEEARTLHYIVIVIDELADLMMVSSHEVEESITRLAQMARAVGIHLILATQRPSVDVITGLIKANFPSRISFKVSARVDSRTILDSIGAEHLLGKGDMLFLPPGSARLLRIHGAFVSEQEIARLTNYLRKLGKPVFDESVGRPEKAAADPEVEGRDELFDEAVRFVVQSGQASTSMLQRRFRIGFSRAGRLIDIMERDRIIGPADGSKPREILVPPDYYATVDSWPK
jgi:DNA segregation ATPase FtsK/SpoIIIE, S-DNA-T family